MGGGDCGVLQVGYEAIQQRELKKPKRSGPSSATRSGKAAPSASKKAIQQLVSLATTNAQPASLAKEKAEKSEYDFVSSD